MFEGLPQRIKGGEAGLEGLWTPVLRSRLGYCDYACHACGQVCPSGAIPPLALSEKKRIDPDKVQLPVWYSPNPGRARDLAAIIFTAGKDEKPRAARITNRRWAVAAYGAAAASTLTPGAEMSGLSRSLSSDAAGPREEKPAICGTGVTLPDRLPSLKVAVAEAPALSR